MVNILNAISSLSHYIVIVGSVKKFQLAFMYRVIEWFTFLQNNRKTSDLKLNRLYKLTFVA